MSAATTGLSAGNELIEPRDGDDSSKPPSRRARRAAAAASLVDDGASRDVDERGTELAEWVRDVLAPVVNRDLNPQGELVWCQLWWEHPEAVARLAALHDAWTALVLDADDPCGTSSWWSQYVDPQLDVLLHKRNGPFSRCAREHRETRGLPWTEPPPGAVRLPIAAGDDAADEAAGYEEDLDGGPVVEVPEADELGDEAAGEAPAPVAQG